MTTIDSKQYKEAERQSWNSVAAGWQKWWQTVEKGAQKVSDRLIELAEIKPGQRVLDLATGIGEPAITAARIVGKMGQVTATDISANMLSLAKQRAMSLGMQDVIEFKEGDIETIDLVPSSFDAVLCRWGLMFLPDLGAGLSNIYRSLIEGGHFSSAVWASPGQDTLSATTMNIVIKETNSKPPAPGTPGPFSLSDENNLKNSFITSGFKDLVTERMTVSFDFKSPDDFTDFITETAGPLQKMLIDQGMQRKTEILRAITVAATNNADKTTGKTRFENEAILIVGTK
ncbi:MAG: class I SAM-dependent methyltransferase [Nitrososphaeraceae archaeon]|nr:class I SAM-dependent methyltransferase [Nitrososphaeraceae archaeon]